MPKFDKKAKHTGTSYVLFSHIYGYNLKVKKQKTDDLGQLGHRLETTKLNFIE